MFELSGRVHPRQKLIHVRGFERGAAGGVEHDRFRGKGLQRGPDGGKGISPGDRHVPVVHRVPAHRFGQPPYFLQLEIRPTLKLGYGVFGKERRGTSFVRYFPCRGFRAVLAKFERTEVRRPTIRAAATSKASGLVLMPESERAL